VAIGTALQACDVYPAGVLCAVCCCLSLYCSISSGSSAGEQDRQRRRAVLDVAVATAPDLGRQYRCHDASRKAGSSTHSRIQRWLPNLFPHRATAAHVYCLFSRASCIFLVLPVRLKHSTQAPCFIVTVTNPFKTSPRAVSIILVLALLADEWARRRKRTVCWPPDRSAPSGPPALFSSPRSALRPATNLAALTVTARFPVPDQTWPCRLLASPTCLVTTARVIIAAFAGKPAGGLSSERPLSSGSERWAIPGGRRHDDASGKRNPPLDSTPERQGFPRQKPPKNAPRCLSTFK